MIHRLHGLVGDNAGVALLQPMATSPVRHPTTAMHDEPEEELDTGWSRHYSDGLFAECLGHSAKPLLHSAKALPSAALGKE